LSPFPPIPQKILPITAGTDVNPHLMKVYYWQLPTYRNWQHFTRCFLITGPPGYCHENLWINQ